jgi:hypothetical protein
MGQLVQTLVLKGNPFEHYVAETEPDISEYAVKPPYFEAIGARANNCSSYVLFGDRGAGKSATRLTVFKEMWSRKSRGDRVPLAVNMTDFSAVLVGKKLHGVSEAALVKEAAFVVIESLLTWLSTLEEDDRKVFVEGMNEDEKALCYRILRDYYLVRPEAKRARSAREAMILLNQALLARNKLWVERRWEPISGIIAAIANALVQRALGEGGIVTDAKALAAKEQAAEIDTILVLHQLVDFVQIFDFSGVVILIDKVDETEATGNSADQTAALIHPLLARVQLLEVKGFSWTYFLWSSVKAFFEGQVYPVRLDKIGHATVTWPDEFFSLMLEKRVHFYSSDKIGFDGLFADSAYAKRIMPDLVRVSMRSPRDLIRLMDVIIREHDILHAEDDNILLYADTVDKGLDSYVKDTVTGAYGDRVLAQIFRLNKVAFANKDVQLTFRIGAQSARNRIQQWENAGIIKLTGTRAAEGALGGKPANEYSIVDARVERIMSRGLIAYVNGVVEEPEFNLDAIE